MIATGALTGSDFSLPANPGTRELKRGRTPVSGHRDNGKRFIVTADEKLRAFLELQRVTRESFRFPNAE
jgi:hypothetical protein